MSVESMRLKGVFPLYPTEVLMSLSLREERMDRAIVRSISGLIYQFLALDHSTSAAFQLGQHKGLKTKMRASSKGFILSWPNSPLFDLLSLGLTSFFSLLWPTDRFRRSLPNNFSGIEREVFDIWKRCWIRELCFESFTDGTGIWVLDESLSVSVFFSLFVWFATDFRHPST